MLASPLHVNEKLNGTNYHQWKFRIKLILMKEGLWKIMEGKRKAPASDSKDTTALEKWETDCDNVFATLCLAITNSEMSHIEECTTAAEVWAKLAKVYEAKGVT